VTSKSAFWQALVFTVIIFSIGLFIGFYIESSRVAVVSQKLSNSELNLLDEQLRNKTFEDLNVSCEQAVNNTFNFADRIYTEAQQLEEYDSAAKFSDSLVPLHKRYDLLRMMLWIETIKLKARCGNSFHTVVYFYAYKTDDINQKAEQNSVSHVLGDLKNQYSSEVLLIPIAGNLELDSISLVTDKYGISDFPAIVIDENKTLQGLVSFDEVENLAFQS